ncbi:hypothetical protein [Ferrovibrio sp.]|uniref:hypothetical protein n=1 Tax=Ferrovibrio sp. TaxID=1917215 RepID=UPI003D14F4F1
MTDNKVVDIRSMREGAEDAPPLESDAPPNDGGGDAPDDDGRRYRLPDGCPVRPLGVMAKLCYYLDAQGQLQELSWKDHSRNNIMGMFGTKNYLLEEFWPRKKKVKDPDTGEEDWIVTGWKPEEAADALVAEASKLGIWSPYERVRGVGAWRGAAGELIIHAGSEIYIGAKPGDSGYSATWLQAGTYGPHLYPTGEAQLRPRARPVPAGGARNAKGRPLNPGDALLADFNTWNLARGEIDAHLLLGAVASQRIGGALDVRPAVWLTGSRGTGKTGLVKAINDFHGGEHGVVKLENTTEAGVRQQLKYSTRPVLLDENGDDGDEGNPQRVRGMIQLMRIAVSGGRFGRGGGDHQGVVFVARSSFMSASILMPNLMPQDRSRMLIVELGQLKAGQQPPDMAADRWRAMGQAVTDRLAQQWHRFDETLALYRALLMKPIAEGGGGHDGRGADIFGTLLACADLVLHDALPHADDDGFTVWAKHLRADELSETSGGQSDEEECWQHLMFSPIDPYRSGGRKLISEWIERAVGAKPEGREIPYTMTEAAEAQTVLQGFGMRLCGLKELNRLYGNKPPPGIAVPFLAVANKHPALAAVFKDRRWGAGVWPQALKRLPGALVPPRPLWLSGGEGDAIAGGAVRVVLVPLYARGAGSGSGGQAGDQPAGAATAQYGNGSADAAPGRAAGGDASLPFDQPWPGGGAAAGPGPGEDDDLPF